MRKVLALQNHVHPSSPLRHFPQIHRFQPRERQQAAHRSLKQREQSWGWEYRLGQSLVQSSQDLTSRQMTRKERQWARERRTRD